MTAAAGPLRQLVASAVRQQPCRDNLFSAVVYDHQAWERVMEALESVGLEERAAHRPDLLSGGERQRVAVARAIVHRPALVLADEPTANLDSSTGATIIALMRRLQRERGVSFVFSSHDQQLLAEMLAARHRAFESHQGAGLELGARALELRLGQGVGDLGDYVVDPTHHLALADQAVLAASLGRRRLGTIEPAGP